MSTDSNFFYDFEDSYITLPNLFEEQEPFFCFKFHLVIEIKMSRNPFIPKFHEFTSNKFTILIKWIMKKMIKFFFI